jgi:hypothetical protein
MSTTGLGKSINENRWLCTLNRLHALLFSCMPGWVYKWVSPSGLCPDACIPGPCPAKPGAGRPGARGAPLHSTADTRAIHHTPGSVENIVALGSSGRCRPSSQTQREREDGCG